MRDVQADLAPRHEVRRDGDGKVLVGRLPPRLPQLRVVRPAVGEVAQDFGVNVRLVARPVARPEADGDGDLLRAAQGHLSRHARVS